MQLIHRVPVSRRSLGKELLQSDCQFGVADALAQQQVDISPDDGKPIRFLREIGKLPENFRRGCLRQEINVKALALSVVALRRLDLLAGKRTIRQDGGKLISTS